MLLNGVAMKALSCLFLFLGLFLVAAGYAHAAAKAPVECVQEGCGSGKPAPSRRALQCVTWCSGPFGRFTSHTTPIESSISAVATT